MARFHFDLFEDGEFTPDPDGLELRSIEAARAEALRTLGGIAKDTALLGDRREVVISVRDGEPEPVLTATLYLRVQRRI